MSRPLISPGVLLKRIMFLEMSEGSKDILSQPLLFPEAELRPNFTYA